MRSPVVSALALCLVSSFALAQNQTPPSGSVPMKASANDEGDSAEKAPTLLVGSAAPSLTIDKWVKGDAVKSFEKGKVYVVEFWATWCVPCKQSIPHLTELQKKYKDKNVTFIGISSAEKNGLKDVEPFVTKMGDKMDYTVAFDKDGKTSTDWMTAAGQNGIPTAFVITGDQKIAWYGHPMNGLDEAVGEVVSGNFDITKAAAKAKHAAEIQGKLAPIMAQVQNAMRNSPPDYTKATDLLDQAIALDPGSMGQLVVGKIRMLGMAMKEPEKAYAYAGQALTTSLKDNAEALNEVAWMFLDDQAFADKRDPALAKKLAERANELTKGKNAEILDTLAMACMQTGEVDRAVELQTKAVELAPEGQAKEELKQRLDDYTKKVKKG